MPPTDTPRPVIFVGPGLRPWSALAALVFFTLPSAATPFIVLALDRTERLDPGLFVPTGCWLLFGLVGGFASVVQPLRRRRLVAEGLLLPGVVTEIGPSRGARGPGPRKVTVRYTDPVGAERTTSLPTARPAELGGKVTVACDPRSPGRATVVELGVWALQTPTVEAAGIPLSRMLLLLGLIAVAMAGLMVGFGGPELNGERVLPPAPWAFPLGGLLTLAAAAWSLRRARKPDTAAMWNVFTIVAVPLALMGAAGLLGQALPQTEHEYRLVVTANFCLELGPGGTACLLELETPDELSFLQLVRTRGEVEAPLGKTFTAVRVDRWFSASTVRGVGFSARDWQPERSVETLFIDKRHPMRELLSGGQVRARGAFGPQSPVRAELDRLGVPHL